MPGRSERRGHHFPPLAPRLRQLLDKFHRHHDLASSDGSPSAGLDYRERPLSRVGRSASHDGLDGQHFPAAASAYQLLETVGAGSTSKVCRVGQEHCLQPASNQLGARRTPSSRGSWARLSSQLALSH
jgi:hypothetical protein